jgi:hypothetical protein
VNPSSPFPAAGDWVDFVAGIEPGVQITYDPDALNNAFPLQLLVVVIAIALCPGPFITSLELTRLGMATNALAFSLLYW